MTWLHVTPHGVTVRLHLSPASRKNGFDRFDLNVDGLPRLRCHVTAVAEKGRANAALIKLLAGKLRLPKTHIQIIAGQQSRDKTVVIVAALEDVRQRFEAALKEAKITLPS